MSGVRRQASGVICQGSGVRWHNVIIVIIIFFLVKKVEVVGGGSNINGA